MSNNAEQETDDTGDEMEMDDSAMEEEDGEEEWDDEGDDGCDCDCLGFGTEITSLDESSLEMLRSNDDAACTRVDLADCPDDVGDEGIAKLCDALSHNTSVEELVLDKVGMGMKGLRALAKLLKSTGCAISDVSLRRDAIGDEGLCVLADALACNRSVISLDLCENGFTSKGARALAVALCKQSSDDGGGGSTSGTSKVSYLTIVKNDLGDAGAEIFAHALLASRSAPLKGLSLMKCNVRDRGAAAFAVSLQRKSALNSLCLTSNSIGDLGAGMLAKMVRYDRSLTHLSLEGNPFGSGGTVELAWALMLNTTLREARVRPAEEYSNDGWPFLEAAALHITDDGDARTEKEVESFVESLFEGAWRSPPSANDIAIAKRNLEEDGFDSPLTITGTAISELSPRKGQRRLLRALCKAGLKRLGQYPALIPPE